MDDLIYFQVCFCSSSGFNNLVSCWSFGRVPRHIVYTKNCNILQNFFFNIHSVFCIYSAGSILFMLYIFAAKVLAFILFLLYLFIIFGYCQISCI